MTMHVLVEGLSESALLERWVPRLLKAEDFRVHPHQGKGSLPENADDRPDPRRRGLLDQLPAKLRGYASSTDRKSLHVVVLVDADDDDPAKLARDIAAAANRVAPDLAVTVCLAVEETEAFYLGDLKALKAAFPKADLKKARAYKPDSICGSWELFGQIVDDLGGNKVAWAEAMGVVLTTRAEESRSPSFKDFVRSMLLVKTQREPKPSRKPHRHAPKPAARRDGKR